jgi:hypothetical protein
LDTLLDAYEQIGERIPSFMHYQCLFERNPEMRRALDLYYCDILEFHYHALQFLSRPGELFVGVDGYNPDQLKGGKSSSTLLGRHLIPNFDAFWIV